MRKLNERSLIHFLKDAAAIFLLRLKLIVRDRTTITALFTSLLIFSVVIHALTESSAIQSAIPVGFVDYDQSKESERLMERVAKVSAIRVVEKNEEELHKMLLDEMINGLFIIEDGYEDRLRKGDLEEIIKMYYIEDNKSASIIADIVAGEMIYPISLYKSIRLYEAIPFEGKKHTALEYQTYIEKLLADSGDFDFAFQMNFENPDSAFAKQEPISNAILYNQLIFGILGILISFIAMFILSGVVREKEMGVRNRLRVSKFHTLQLDFGNLCASLATEGIIVLLFSILIFRQLHTLNLRIFVSAFLLMITYAAVMGGIFLLFAKLVRSIIVYQMFCSVFILITGGLGFYHLLTGFYQYISMDLLKIIPNSWFIQGFTDIILYGRGGGVLFEAHHMLLLLTTVILMLILIVDLLGSKIGLRFNKMKETNRVEE